MAKKEQSTPVIVNRKANHLYFVDETFEVGIMLIGSEVKSIRDGKCTLGEAWIDIDETKNEMEYREQVVVFRKGEINHMARIITYVDIKKGKQPKLVSLLTNDFDMSSGTIVAIYRKRWQIESLFKQIKQNFPLRYFYGESANAIKIQIWVTLIANLLLSMLQTSLERSWSFSGLATMVRIVLMYYLNMQTFFNQPDADLKILLAQASETPPDITEKE